MIAVKNPFLESPNYQCFGCSPFNQAGLQMEFFKDGEEVVAKWIPKEHFMGFDNILHGGIRATLIDEIAAWVVFLQLGTMGYTTKLTVNYTDVVYTNRGPITLRAKIREKSKKSVLIDVNILNEEEKVVTTGEAEYFVIPAPIARKKMNFPAPEAFFSEKE